MRDTGTSCAFATLSVTRRFGNSTPTIHGGHAGEDPGRKVRGARHRRHRGQGRARCRAARPEFPGRGGGRRSAPKGISRTISPPGSGSISRPNCRYGWRSASSSRARRCERRRFWISSNGACRWRRACLSRRFPPTMRSTITIPATRPRRHSRRPRRRKRSRSRPLAEPYLGDFDHLPLPDVCGLSLLGVDPNVPRPQVRLLGDTKIKVAHG